ncbi:MAG: flagellar hook capping protein [Planctomycetota bacterium]|nr:flagellar hook capping protein [Planctomycetota bacterium]
MAVNDVTSAGSSTSVDASKIGFSGLTSQDFMKLLIAQLQNQDPLQPTDNEQLLNQITSMQNLQSNIELESTLKALGANQQLSSAASLLGQTVTGVTDGQLEITGKVDQIFLKNKAVYLGVGGNELPLANVATIRAA